MAVLLKSHQVREIVFSSFMILPDTYQHCKHAEEEEEEEEEEVKRR